MNGYASLPAFYQIEEDLSRLIRRYGLPNSRQNAHYPFWHLQNDGLWQVDKPELVGLSSSGDPHVSDLRRHEIRGGGGGFIEEFLSALDARPDFAWKAVHLLLTKYFPPTLHDDILEDVGLSGKIGPSWLMDATLKRETRDPRSREAVLQAYRSRCAICELDVQFMGQPVGIEAAHIKWHCANGPAQVENGIALCMLHHKFFDSGLFTVLSDLTVQVGRSAVGNSVEESLNKYAGSPLALMPDQSDHRPAVSYLRWHKLAVFKG